MLVLTCPILTLPERNKENGSKRFLQLHLVAKHLNKNEIEGEISMTETRHQ